MKSRLVDRIAGRSRAQVPRAPKGARAVVIGGGLAGVAAATVLGERGVRVSLVEREDRLGGRVGAWTEEIRTGDRLEMERGFHAFFRQYYNLRSLLRRIDPELRFLKPLEDYPIFGPDGAMESFAALPSRAPFNVIELVRRTRTLGLRDLLRVNRRAALEMLRYERDRVYGRYDHRTAADYLDSLKFPPDARRMLFDVFAHSFFNPEDGMSAAELLMMFHFYFMGNPEGLIFDVLDEPFSTALWGPFADYLEERGVEIDLSRPAARIERLADRRWAVTLEDGGVIEADAVVLAVTVPALQQIVAASPDLPNGRWREGIESLDLTLPFAVWRLWARGELEPGRLPFAGTAGLGILDNISLYHLFEGESGRWAAQNGGSVIELHAYAVPEDLGEEEIKSGLRTKLYEVYPEARLVEVLDERFLLRQDCPAFGPGSDALRPGVRTPFPGLVLAGDFVRLPIPTALMERATCSGFMAANFVLERWNVTTEPIRHIRLRGLIRV